MGSVFSIQNAIINVRVRIVTCSMKYTGSPLVEFRGKSQTLTQWCKELGFEYRTIWNRLNRGESLEEAFSIKSRARKIEFRGITLTVKEWAKAIGISENSLYFRLSRKWPLEKALTHKKHPKMLFHTHNGETLSTLEWANRAGINTHAFYMRIVKLKWPFEKALNTPIKEYAEPEGKMEISLKHAPGHRMSYDL